MARTSERLCLLLSLAVAVTLIKAEEVWVPSAFNHCRTNNDCTDPQKRCCSITPIIVKRKVGIFRFPMYAHTCAKYHTLDSALCSLRHQYNVSAPYYLGQCPCGPGLRCTPTTELDPKIYPRERFGKCTRA